MNPYDDGAMLQARMRNYVDASPVPLGMKATHDLVVIEEETMEEGRSP